MSLFLTSLLSVLLGGPGDPPASPRAAVKVFLLVGQSNMEGKGAPRHLEALLANKQTRKSYQHLKRGKKWVVRKDVMISYKRGKGRAQYGGLTIGYGSNGKQFGPEFGFGHVVGEQLKGRILLIKCAWGGASLRKSFLPPGAGGPGPLYKEMVEDIHATLKKRARNYKIAGLVWFQGWNDAIGGGNPKYTEQLAQFIRDVRKEFKVPAMPVVIGELGQAGPKASGKVARFRKQQAAVAELPEFQATVRFVKTGELLDPRLPELFALWQKCTGAAGRAKKNGDAAAEKKAMEPWEAVKDEWDSIASDRGYHYYGSGKMFYAMGAAFGTAMVEMVKRKK